MVFPRWEYHCGIPEPWSHLPHAASGEGAVGCTQASCLPQDRDKPHVWRGGPVLRDPGPCLSQEPLT